MSVEFINADARSIPVPDRSVDLDATIVADDDALIDWLFSINYPFDTSWPTNPPPVDHRKLAVVWNERDDWRVSNEDAYLCICVEAGIEPADTEGSN